jgi:hypothetical protein
MDIADYFKAESQKNVIYYLLPGVIAFWPYSILIYRYFDFHLDSKLNDYFIYVSIVFFILSMGFGTLVEDLGARIELWLDKAFQSLNNISEVTFYEVWNKYLILKIPKIKEPAIMRYYRSLLLRLKFELHTSISIGIMLIGHFLLRLFYPLKIDWPRSLTYVGICLLVLIYLLFESYSGVAALHELRVKMNEDFENNKDFYKS